MLVHASIVLSYLETKFLISAASSEGFCKTTSVLFRNSDVYSLWNSLFLYTWWLQGVEAHNVKLYTVNTTSCIYKNQMFNFQEVKAGPL